MNKNIFHYSIFIFAFLALTTNFVFAQNAPNIDEFIQKQLETQKVAGASVAVLRDGKILTAKGYGFENIENKTPASAETVYEIASLTKQFTAAGIMLLAEDGKIKIDAPISEYLENMPEKWRSVTVRQLLTHTSGIKNYTASTAFNPAQDYKRDEIIKLVADDAFDFEPGASWNYSNTNYFLLGLMIEKVSGENYAGFMQKKIFAPLGMKNTGFNNLDAINHRAVGYSLKDGELQKVGINNPNQAFSAGAIVSTVTDLAKWDAALMGENLLKKTSLAESWTPVKLSNGKAANYGFGWGVSKYRGLDFVGHSGAINGFSSNITRFTNDKLTVIVLTNSSGRAAEKIALDVAALYLPQLTQNAPPAQKTEDNDLATSKFLREAIEKFAAGNADPAWFTPEAQKAYFPERAQQMQTILSRQGELKTFEFINEELRGANKLRNYRLGYANSAIRFGFILTPEGKMVGVILRPE
jgi:D-alanyl-D-alanine carboxypeptidase